MSNTTIIPGPAAAAFTGTTCAVNNASLPGPSLSESVFLVGSALSGALIGGSPQFWEGGAGALVASGTFGGASIQLQMLGPDLSTWLNIDSAITQAGSATFSLPAAIIQCTLSSVGATTNLTVVAQPVPTTIN